MTQPNVVFIMSDQHQGKASGCYGHDFVRTPNIDSLAESGTLFSRAYTSSPICTPARAALATGQYIHRNECWDNGHPYDGRPKSWHHMLREHGVPTTSIGKLHFRSEADDTGFETQIIPMHAVEGVGELRGCIKRPMTKPMTASHVMTDIGPGDSPYIRYDLDIAERSCAWLRSQAAKPDGKPFVGFISFVCPHPPHLAPREFYDIYARIRIPEPKAYAPESPVHPWIALQRNQQNYNDFVTPETWPVLMKSYYGCISYLDQNIGKVLKTLEETGLRNNTFVIYTSDHGENLGARRMWGKCNMYEEASNIPMIISGPGIPPGETNLTPVTLIDVAPTMLDAMNLPGVAEANNLPGISMIELAKTGGNPERVAFTEYYAAGAETAAFMLRRGKFKYIHYVDFEPELFDLDTDPEELANLCSDPAYRNRIQEFEAILRGIVDPEAVNEAAYLSQCRKVAAAGGREAIIARGKYQVSPPPGEPIVWVP
ncbi:MAG: sulfatase-like hydrolase/transferase [Rhodospirillales bacterium]